MATKVVFTEKTGVVAFDSAQQWPDKDTHPSISQRNPLLGSLYPVGISSEGQFILFQITDLIFFSPYSKIRLFLTLCKYGVVTTDSAPNMQNICGNILSQYKNITCQPGDPVGIYKKLIF